MANEALQQGTIDKRHTLLSQLTPAIEIKVLGSYAISIPFNYITKFEFDVNQMQAHLEMFDSSFYIIDTFAFILAKLSGKGVPIKIKWGYAVNSATPTITNERVQIANQSIYMSKDYDMTVLNVESNPDEKGSRVTMLFAVNIIDPVLTSVAVKKVFVSGDIASFTTNSKELQNTLINTWKKGSEDDKKRAETAEKLIKRVTELTETGKASNEEALRRALEGQFGPNVEIISNGGKLTFTKIYFRLMDIALKAQNKLGFDRKASWEIPLPVFPEDFDNNYDFLIFNCNNDNIYSNLQRLGSMMTSKDTRLGKSPQNFNLNSTSATTPPAQPQPNAQENARFRMVGGNFTFHSAKIDNQILGANLYKDANSTIRFDQSRADQTAFCVWSFTEAPFEVNVDEEPIARYRFHAGEPNKFDENNLTEVLSFSAEFNNVSKYFIASNGFGLENVRNTKTGASVNTTANDAQTGEDVLNQQRQLTGDNQSVQLPTSSQTNPMLDRENTNRSSSSVSASPDQSTQKKFEIPASINPDRDKEILKAFDDAIKSSVRDRFAVFNADLSIIGDPRFDAVFKAYNKMIYFDYINKQGNTNPIYTGHYRIINIKHSIENGKYTTALNIFKVPESNVKTGKTEDSFIANNPTRSQGFDNPTTDGQIITNAQISVSAKFVSGKWRVSTINAYSGEEYKDKARVDKMLSNADIKKKVQDGAEKVLGTVTSNKINDLLNQAKGRVAVEAATKQNIGDGEKDYLTKFTIFSIEEV